MVMLPVLKNPVIDDDVAGFRNEAFFSFVVLYLNITLRKFFPGDTACQVFQYSDFFKKSSLYCRQSENEYLET